ncbi:MAG: hypothetical protein ACFFB3_04910 [Candidatus Hodarchaeota archaeon]
MIRRIRPLLKEAFLCSIFLALLLGMITAVPNVPSMGISDIPSESPGISTKESSILPIIADNGNETADNDTAIDYSAPINLTMLLDFLDHVLNITQSLHSNRPGEHLSLIATYQATFIARVLGLDHFKAAVNAERIANLTAEEDLGFRINNETEGASVAGTFGAGNALYMLNATDLVNISGARAFLQSRYNSTTGSFREPGKTGNLLTTYQAVQVDQILEANFITSTRVDHIVSFLEILWKEDGYFLDSNLKEGPFIQTWLAISLLEELNSTKAVQINETQLAGYSELVENWTILNYNEFLANDSLNVQDAVAAAIILQKLNHLDSSSLNITKFVDFIASSQQLETELTSVEGGFAASPTANEDTISLENTFMAVMGLLTIGKMFENLNMTLSTSSKTANTLPHQVIQGDDATIQMTFDLFNSTIPEVDFLNLTIEIDGNDANWTFTEVEYNDQSSYSSSIESSDNWTLGNHTVMIFANLDRVPFISLSNHLFEDYITVNYEIEIQVNTTSYFRPTDGVQLDFQVMNRSATTHESRNVTDSNASIMLQYPIDGKFRNLTNVLWNGSAVPSNDTNVFQLEVDGLTTINFTIPNRVVLGDYTLRIANVSTGQKLRDFAINVYVPLGEFRLLALNDTLNFCTSRNESVLTPGKAFNLTATMKYTRSPLRLPNGSLNASFVMTSTLNDSLSFSIPFEFWKDINETTVYHAVENETVPLRPLMGNYTVAVEFTWNLTGGYSTSSILNPDMPLVYVAGTVIAQNATIISESGNLSSGSVTVFYGEEVNTTFEIAINETSVSLLEDIAVRSFVWNMSGGLVQELAYLNQTNATHPFTATIDPNAPHGAYQIAVQLTLPHNGTVLNVTNFYVQGIDTPLIFQEFQFTLAGTLELLEHSIRYITVSNEENQTAIDEFPLFSASFQVHCNESDEFITGLDIYGELAGEETATFFDVGFSKSEKYYQVRVTIENLPAGQYELKLYTQTAVTADTFIGSIQLDLVETLEPSAEEEEIEWPIIISAVLVLLTLVLLGWNLRLR